jgi:hypothetical protein
LLSLSTGELREYGAQIGLHLWLWLHRLLLLLLLLLGEAGPLLELLHHAHELLEVHTARHSWWLSDRHLWNLGDLRDLRLGLLLAEQANSTLEVGHGCLLGDWLRGRSLLLRGPGLDDLE